MCRSALSLAMGFVLFGSLAVVNAADRTTRIAAVCQSWAEADRNPGHVLGLLDRAAARQARVVCLPEDCVAVGGEDDARQALRAIAAKAAEAKMLVAANLKEKQGDTDGAIQEYKSASDWATAFTQGNYMMHMRLRGKFEELKKADLVEQEQAWIDDYMATQSEMGVGGGMPITIPSQ